MNSVCLSACLSAITPLNIPEFNEFVRVIVAQYRNFGTEMTGFMKKKNREIIVNDKNLFTVDFIGVILFQT